MGVVLLRTAGVFPHIPSPTPETLTVNTTTDLVSANPLACAQSVTGQCSLRQAIIEAIMSEHLQAA